MKPTTLHSRCGYVRRMALAAIALPVLAMGTACSSAQPGDSNLPAASAPFAPAIAELAWVGFGEAYLWKDGAWVRTPAQDYELSVIQRRYADRWESLKTQNRRSPDYDGAAGPRDQVNYFRLELSDPEAGRRKIAVRSSFGDGAGSTDAENRESVLDIAARGANGFMPFNAYRITQHYRYESGELKETVLLYKAGKDGKETPFVRIEESARVFTPAKLPGAPFVAGQSVSPPRP